MNNWAKCFWLSLVLIFVCLVTNVYAHHSSGLWRGVNFGNTLESPNHEGEWGYKIQDHYFDLLADAGFDHVRIPIRWNAYADTEPPYTLSPSILQRVEHLVNYGL